MKQFNNISEAELEMPGVYWEDTPRSIRYRLYRFEAHIRQHTVQIDKTLTALGLLPNEAKLVLQLLYSALAEVNGVLIGADETGRAECQQLAQTISVRTDELSVRLNLSPT